MKISEIIVDPDLESFLPPLSADERHELKNQIQQDGFTDPIIVWLNHATIVDGHNRYRIWQELGSDPDNCPEIIEKKFTDKADVMAYMFHRQIGRRNWTPAQKAMTVEKMRPAIEHRAKENQKSAGGDKISGTKALSTNSSKALNPVDTRKELAKIAGVSEDTIRKTETVLKEGTPEIQAAMAAGEMSANKAFHETKKISGGTTFDPSEWETPETPEEAAELGEEPTADGAPAHLKEVLAGVKDYRSLQREFSMLISKVQRIANMQVGACIRMQVIEQHIGQVKSDLKAYSFGDNCPTCKNKIVRECLRCKGRGWIAHSQLGSLSDFEKDWLAKNGVSKKRAKK